MTYLYHQIPKETRGKILYPLNQLEDLHFELYEPLIEKYKGREHTLEQTIPPLNCFWNDVLFFTAVHPYKIREVFAEIGQSFSGRRYYEINPTLLDPSRSIIYLYQHRRREDEVNPENFESYSLENIEKYTNILPETKEYYKTMFAEGKRPLLYHRIPHILYKGSLNVENLNIIET